MFFTDTMKRLISQGFKFCVGCGKIDAYNRCHSIDVCGKNAVRKSSFYKFLFYKEGLPSRMLSNV